MADEVNKSKEVNMNGADVPQHKRMAAGEKVDGKKVPSKENSGNSNPGK